MLVGFMFTYFPMFILGMMGMPRRYYDYLPRFEPLHVISTVGSWVLVIGLLMMIFNLIMGYRKGDKTGKNPWNGLTLEWQTDSPPTLENFDEIPTVKEGPYEYKS